MIKHPRADLLAWVQWGLNSHLNLGNRYLEPQYLRTAGHTS